jgi:cytochrome P450 monooxygenase
MTMQMLCELLGVPQSEREAFPELVRRVFSLADVDNATSSNEMVYGYFRGLAARKRADPGEDVISALASAGLDDPEITELAAMMLYAAYGSTSNNLALGIARLCADPRLRDELAKNPDRMPDAVEECLRTASSGGFILPHYARKDIELDGVTIRKGDLVLLDYALANFDEEVFRILTVSTSIETRIHI